jgi:hypothetical protein
MPYQKGFIPIFIPLILLLLVGSGAVVYQQVHRNHTTPMTQSTPSPTGEATQSPSPTATASAKVKASPTKTPIPIVKPSATSSTSTASNSSSNTSTSNNTTSNTSPTTTSSTSGVTLTYPNGGETVDWSSPMIINWSAPGAAGVALRVMKNGSHLVDIIPYTSNSGTYTWTPSSQIGSTYAGSGFKIRIEANGSVGSYYASDESDSSFSINVTNTPTPASTTPQITNISPSIQYAGYNVDIYGLNFGSSTGTVTLKQVINTNGDESGTTFTPTIVSWSAYKITISVPNGVYSSARVYVQSADNQSTNSGSSYLSKY